LALTARRECQGVYVLHYGDVNDYCTLLKCAMHFGLTPLGPDLFRSPDFDLSGDFYASNSVIVPVCVLYGRVYL
jgi:hypothetical protein